MERGLVTREGVEFVPIKAGALHGVGPGRVVRGMLRNAQGALQALRIVGAFKPDVVLLTGGFVGVPVAMAARARGVPSVVYLPDIEPGTAVKFMSRFATRIATTTEASGAYLPRRKMIVTGYPVREVFASVEREAARARFGAGPHEPVLLVFGGSKGARSINRAVVAGLAEILALARVIHVTGALDWDEVMAARDALGDAQRSRYAIYPYLHEDMAAAMAAADLAVCRSGASALGELPYVGLPAVLIPYPHAWRYQKVNAAYLADRGAAVVLSDGALTDPQAGLTATVRALLGDGPRLARMRSAALGMARRDGAERIAGVLLELAAASGATGSPGHAEKRSAAT